MLAAIAAAWMVGLSHRPRLAAVYVTGLLVLFAVLVTRSPLYGFFVFTGYLSVDDLHGWWRAPPVIITGLLSAVCQAGGFPCRTTPSPRCSPPSPPSTS